MNKLFLRFYADKRRNILTILMTVCLIISTSFLYEAPSAAASYDKEQSDGLTVGVPADRCPVFYTDRKTNEVTGIGSDLIRIAAENAGYNITFRIIEEGSLKEAIDNSEYDILLPFGSAVTSSSGKQTVVSDNLFQTPFTLVTLNDHNVTSLNGINIGMLKSLAAGAETVRQLYPGISITLYETMEDSVKDLRSGKIDALLHNSYVWSYVLQKPSYSDLTARPSEMFSMDFRAGTADTPEGRKVIDRLNSGIANLTDEQRQAVILDYTTRKLYHYDTSDYLYEQWPFLLVSTILILTLIIIAVLRIKALRRRQKNELNKLIELDPLTGALSLTGFRNRAAEILKNNPDCPFVLTYSNIRNFKFINDSLGMDAGDELLRFWVEQSRKVMSDIEAIARIEADHIAVLRRIGPEGQFENDNSVIFDRIRKYFTDRDKKIRVQICTGIYVLKPEDYININIDQMLDYARVAEKRLRGDHNDGFAFYHTDQWEEGKQIVSITSRLNTALKSDEIKVWYQPQISYDTGLINGAEALCRWNHSNQGWISPAVFIPALEEAGLIYDLDYYVWETVCKDLSRWNKEGRKVTVSVNLSRADFAKNKELPDHFLDLIKKYELSADQLHLEITETAYVDNPELLISTTKKFREFGFHVEMDDFGSGYSSLNMLKEVEVDRIKLDLHFLTETGDQEKGRVIVQHIIQMAHSLGMDIIAEGVERKDQARFLNESGCKNMQGYYYYKPMPAAEFEQLQ